MPASPALILLGLCLGYFLGSIPFSQLIAQMRSGSDLRVAGYRNVGAYNVVRTTGIGWGLLAGCLDAAKGIAVLVLVNALGVIHPLDKLCGFCAILGHNYPIWLKFRGGKGVMVVVGLLFWTVPMETVLAVISSFVVFGVVRLVNVSTASGLIVLLVLTRIFQHYERVELLLWGAVVLIGMAYTPRFFRWLLMQLSLVKARFRQDGS